MFLKKKNGQKNGFPPKKRCTFFFGQFRFSSLLLHDITRRFRRVCTKKPYKNRVFWPQPVAGCRRNRKTEEKKGKGPKKKVTPKKWGALKKGRK